MKKLLTSGGSLAALLLAALAFLSLPLRAGRDGPPRLEGSCAGAGPLEAGAAEVPLEVPAPRAIAGFPRLSYAAEGVRDPVAARALVAGEGRCAVGFVSAEILVVPDAVARAVEDRTRDLGLFHVVLAATHTHAGPGGYWDSFPAERLAAGGYDPRAFEAVAGAMTRALRAAHAARRPARLEAGAGEAKDLVLSRVSDRVDGRLVSLRFTAANDARIGEIALLAAHPTMLGARNRLLSGDWPGALMRGRPAPLLFFQGAVGDQTTHLPPGAEESLEGYARAVAARLDGMARSAPDPVPLLAAARAAVPLPLPSPGGAPGWLRRAAANVFAGTLPAEARVAAIRLGPVTLLAAPAEPTARVGAAWRAAAGPGVEVLSLAGGYAGYVETPERMARGEGETARTYYGPQLAARLEGAIRVAALAARGARSAEPPPAH